MEGGGEKGVGLLLLLLHAARTCCLRGGLNDSLTQSQKCRAHAKHSTRIAAALLPSLAPFLPPFSHSLCSLVCQVAPCLCLCSQYPVLAFGKVIYAMSMHSMSSVKSKREPYTSPSLYKHPCPTLIEIFANANIFQVVHKYLCNLLRIQLMLIFAQCTRIFLAYEMRNKRQQQRL